MLVAVCDQKEGVSMPCCSKMVSPVSEVIAAVRKTHSMSP